jgi:hypothetical protein
VTALDRSAFQARLEANAVTADVALLTLPSSGDQVYMRTTVDRHMVERSYVAATDDDRPLVGMINLLKFLLVDEDGAALPRTFAEARGWFTSLDDADALVVIEHVQGAIESARTSDKDPDAPKGS